MKDNRSICSKFQGLDLSFINQLRDHDLDPENPENPPTFGKLTNKPKKQRNKQIKNIDLPNINELVQEIVDTKQHHINRIKYLTIEDNKCKSTNEYLQAAAQQAKTLMGTQKTKITSTIINQIINVENQSIQQVQVKDSLPVNHNIINLDSQQALENIANMQNLKSNECLDKVDQVQNDLKALLESNSNTQEQNESQKIQSNIQSQEQNNDICKLMEKYTNSQDNITSVQNDQEPTKPVENPNLLMQKSSIIQLIDQQDIEKSQPNSFREFESNSLQKITESSIQLNNEFEIKIPCLNPVLEILEQQFIENQILSSSKPDQYTTQLQEPYNLIAKHNDTNQSNLDQIQKEILQYKSTFLNETIQKHQNKNPQIEQIQNNDERIQDIINIQNDNNILIEDDINQKIQENQEIIKNLNKTAFDSLQKNKEVRINQLNSRLISLDLVNKSDMDESVQQDTQQQIQILPEIEEYRKIDQGPKIPKIQEEPKNQEAPNPLKTISVKINSYIQKNQETKDIPKIQDLPKIQEEPLLPNEKKDKQNKPIQVQTITQSQENLPSDKTTQENTYLQGEKTQIDKTKNLIEQNNIVIQDIINYEQLDQNIQRKSDK